MSRINGRCDVKKCRREGYLIYYEKDICLHHWEMHCNEGSRFDLRRVFGIPYTRIKISVPPDRKTPAYPKPVDEEKYNLRKPVRRIVR